MKKNSKKNPTLHPIIVIIFFLIVIASLFGMTYYSFLDLERDVDINAKSFLQAIKKYDEINNQPNSDDNQGDSLSYKRYIEEGEVPLIEDAIDLDAPSNLENSGTESEETESDEPVSKDSLDNLDSLDKQALETDDQVAEEEVVEPKKLSITTNISGNEGNQEANLKKLWTIQIASFQQEAKAKEAWQSYKEKNKTLFQDFEASFDTLNFNNKTYTRLRIGTFTSYSQAQTVCDRLKKNKYACLIVKL